MTITIHRGQDQIGGSIIEIASDTTRVIFDAGSELDEENPTAPQLEGLFFGQASCDAVFISRYHGDHLGLCSQILPGIPIYIGKGAAQVTNAARRYLGRPEYQFSGFFESGKPVTIGDICVTPYLCDHSAFDSYMFHITCHGKSVFYTGDFRANGRKNFGRLLQRLPHADALIVEGTTLSRTSEAPKTEQDLERLAAEEMEKTDGPVFVMQAATNIDRLVTVFKAARRSDRVLMQDLYTAEIACAAGDSIPNPKSFSGVRVFLTDGRNGRHELLDAHFPESKIGRDAIAQQRFVMCVRPSMQRYLEKLADVITFHDGILFYSMWNGYKNRDDISAFLRFMQGQGVRVTALHTSGHADAQAIRTLIDKVGPDYLIPVHTQNADWFGENTTYNVVRSKCLELK